MKRGSSERGPGVRLLDPTGASLAAGIPASAPGTIYFRSAKGGIVAPPNIEFSIVFGRDEPNVHVAVGVGDRYVSREHGRVTREHDHWTLANRGTLPLRLPGSTHLLTGGSMPLANGYTPIIVRYRHGPVHVLEAFVVPLAQPPPETADDSDPTSNPRLWVLSENERLALIVLSRRYLSHDTHAQPLSWGQAAEDLAAITEDARWTPRRVERLVEGVRQRLSQAGVVGLTRDEVGEPIGNTLNHNLITELLLTATLVPPDLAEIDVLEWCGLVRARYYRGRWSFPR